VDVRFLNGPNVPTPIFGNGGFVMLRPGLELPAQAVILDSANNEIFTVPVQ
jgi:hypothetical protein